MAPAATPTPRWTGPLARTDFTDFLESAAKTHLYAKVTLQGGAADGVFLIASGRVVVEGARSSSSPGAEQHEVIDLLRKNIDSDAIYSCSPLLGLPKADGQHAIDMSEVLSKITASDTSDAASPIEETVEVATFEVNIEPRPLDESQRRSTQAASKMPQPAETPAPKPVESPKPVAPAAAATRTETSFPQRNPSSRNRRPSNTQSSDAHLTLEQVQPDRADRLRELLKQSNVHESSASDGESPESASTEAPTDDLVATFLEETPEEEQTPRRMALRGLIRRLAS